MQNVFEFYEGTFYLTIWSEYPQRFKNPRHLLPAEQDHLQDSVYRYVGWNEGDVADVYQDRADTFVAFIKENLAFAMYAGVVEYVAYNPQGQGGSGSILIEWDDDYKEWGDVDEGTLWESGREFAKAVHGQLDYTTWELVYNRLRKDWFSPWYGKEYRAVKERILRKALTADK